MPFSLSIIIPAFNESLDLADSVNHVLDSLPTLVGKFELILVNDGSGDATGSIINKLAACHSSVIPVHHERNSGKGAALASGFRRARMDWLLFIDADHQIDITELRSFLDFVDGYDVIIGYRLDRKKDPLIRRILSKVFNRLIFMSLGVRTRDVNCPFKLIKRSVLSSFQMVSKGFLIDAELLYRSAIGRIRVKELGVVCHPRLKGRSTVRFRHFLETLKELVVLIIEKNWKSPRAST
jgi:glycosyltransferase involved in cell wall biosynthesis